MQFETHTKTHHMPELQIMASHSAPDGIAVHPTPITAGQRVTVFYNGLLAKSGAPDVWLHVGYGPNNHWQYVQTYKMNKNGYGFDLTFDVTGSSRLNICFKDGADHWDNNYGNNWSYEIHNGERM